MNHLTREELHQELQRLSRREIELTLTNNASSYVSFCPSRTPLPLRLQRVFLTAPDEVIIALGRWIGGREKRCPSIIRKFINRRQSSASAAGAERPGRASGLRPVGHCYNLETIFRRVNAGYFGGRLTSRIGWGRQSSRRYVQVRTLGSYYRGQNLIMINPVLDQPQVPRWFVEFTVYHECLHAIQKDGERPHNATFQERLRSHPDHARAMGWEKANIRLLTRRSERCGKPAAMTSDEAAAAAARRAAAHRVRRPRRDSDGQLSLPW